MSFNDIYNQEQQKAVLQRAMETDRIAHAYLFHGMEGVGKKTAARVFAKALNCRNGSIDSCDECPSCVKIDHGTHPDVIIVAPKGAFIKIEDIRNIHSQSQFRPFEGEKRVFIMENADRMNEPSANALLKTLEEPNRSNILILVTSRPDLLPITIRSRCQKLRFSPVQKETVAMYLREKRSLDGKGADVIASSSRGSIGKAVEMMDEAYLTFKNEVIEKIAGWDGSRDPLAFLSFADEFGNDKKDLSERLEILKSWYRDMLVFKETGETAAL
ncbi:MAG: DNA polymerase III subunit delta', partial [Deltaproteobacteria bacterium]|nr:DNA polymerase III subunit delta' [Deltaproteobacteria bacterium]